MDQQSPQWVALMNNEASKIPSLSVGHEEKHEICKSLGTNNE